MTNQPSSNVLVWDLPLRVFHWSLATAFIVAYALGDSERWRDVHVAVGYGALALIAFRLLWGFTGTRHARFRSFAYSPMAAWRYLGALARGRAGHYAGHNPAGSWAIFGMLALGLATGLSGWFVYQQPGGEALEEAHEVLANLWLSLIIAHVVAVIVSSAAHRENLPRTMLTGYKRAEPAEAADGPRTAAGVALALAIAALVGGLLAYGTGTDPGLARANNAAPSEIAERERRGDD